MDAKGKACTCTTIILLLILVYNHDNIICISPKSRTCSSKKQPKTGKKMYSSNGSLTQVDVKGSNPRLVL